MMILVAVLIATLALAAIDIYLLENKLADAEEEKEQYEKIIDLFSERED